MSALQERLRKEAADVSYDQWLEKKNMSATRPKGHGKGERKHRTYSRSTASSRAASKQASVSIHKSNPQLTSAIKVNPKQAKRNVTTVGKPEKMQPYTNYPPAGHRTSMHCLSKTRSEPSRSGRSSRATIRSAASVPAGVRYYSKLHQQQATMQHQNNEEQKQNEDITERKETYESGKGMEGSKQQQAEQRQQCTLRDADKSVNEEQLIVVEKISEDDGKTQELEKMNNEGEKTKITDGSNVNPLEDGVDELDFTKLKENDLFVNRFAGANECSIEGEEDDLFHDVGQTNSLNALSLPNTLTKDRTPAELVQLLRSFGGHSGSYNRSNSFSYGHSMVHRGRSQRRLSLGAIPEGQIVTSYSDEDQSTSQLLDDQFLESLICSLSSDSGKQNSLNQDGGELFDLESDESEILSCSTSSEDESMAEDDDQCKSVRDQEPVLPKVEISQDDSSPLVRQITRPQSLKVVNLAWDPVLNTVQSHISESPLSQPDFSSGFSRRTQTHKLTPPSRNSNAQSHRLYSPSNSQASIRSQSGTSIQFSPSRSPRSLSPSSSSSSVHSQSRSQSPLASSHCGTPAIKDVEVGELEVSEL